MTVTIQMIPQAFFPHDAEEAYVAHWCQTLQQNFARAVGLASAAGLTLTWRALIVHRGMAAPVLRPDRWLIQWSRAYRFYDAQRSHVARTLDAYFAPTIVAAPYTGYAPRRAGWWVANFNTFATLHVHEMGHALGLGHVADPGNLMYPHPKRTGVLTPEQVAQIAQSRWAGMV